MSVVHSHAFAADAALVPNDLTTCGAHFECDRLAVPTLSRAACSVSLQPPCVLHTKTAVTDICGSVQPIPVWAADEAASPAPFECGVGEAVGLLSALGTVDAAVTWLCQHNGVRLADVQQQTLA